MTDEEYVRLCLGGNPEMFRHLVMRYESVLIKHLIGRLGDGAGSRWFRIDGMDQRLAYKSPGLYRCENRDLNGAVTYVSIEDEASRARLEINYKTRTATLGYLAESSYPPHGPFERYLELMQREDLGPLGKKDVAGRPANGFRFEIRNGLLGEYRSVDFWLDAANKQLVRCQQPGEDLVNAAEIVRDRAWALSSGETLEYQGKVFKFAHEGGVNQGSIISDVDVELDDAAYSRSSHSRDTTSRPPSRPRSPRRMSWISWALSPTTTTRRFPIGCPTSPRARRRISSGSSGPSRPSTRRVVRRPPRSIWWRRWTARPGPDARLHQSADR